MSEKDIPDADLKAATLKMQLHADSGYESIVEYRISANQWSRILSVAEDGEKARLIAAAPELLKELKSAVAHMDLAADCIENGRIDEALLHLRSLSRERHDAISKATGEQQ